MSKEVKKILIVTGISALAASALSFLIAVKNKPWRNKV